MRTLTLLLAVPLLVTCASAPKAPVTRPAVKIVQTSGVPAAARNISGAGIAVAYRIAIENRADEAIKLERITMQSVGEGAYTMYEVKRPYDVTIDAHQTREVDFTGEATATGSISGANGPVTMRAILHFATPKGSFEEVTLQQVHDRSPAD
ncbi:MAG TPA: hypothetical protein VF824_07530 [Thermoanaerobaculia bacterium]|jgi:uncharacterized protein YcfL